MSSVTFADSISAVREFWTQFSIFNGRLNFLSHISSRTHQTEKLINTTTDNYGQRSIFKLTNSA